MSFWNSLTSLFGKNNETPEPESYPPIEIIDKDIVSAVLEKKSMASIEELVALAKSDYPYYDSECDCNDCESCFERNLALKRIEEIDSARVALEKLAPHLYNANVPFEEPQDQSFIDRRLAKFSRLARARIKPVVNCGFFNHIWIHPNNGVRLTVDPQYFSKRASEDLFRIHLFMLNEGRDVSWKGYDHEGGQKILSFEDVIVYLNRDASDMLIETADIFYD